MGRRTQMRHSEEWWSTAPVHVLRCTAPLKSDGGRCLREALPGTNVCRIHGGATPAVQAAAATRIGMTVELAVKELQRILTDPNAADRDKIIVAKDLLDRGGLGATSKVLVGIGSVDPVEQLFQDLLATPGAFGEPEQPALGAGKHYEADPDENPLLASENAFDGLDDVVDAEVVEDAEPEPTRPHTVDIGEVGKTPEHIRKALERLL